MHKILEGKWGKHADTSWEFFVSKDLPKDIAPSAAIGLPIYNNQIILVRTKRGWEMPGGHIEEGESTLDCLKRELEEEIGATDITNVRLFGFRKIVNPDRKVFGDEDRQYSRNTIVPYYLVDITLEPTGPITQDCFEYSKFDIHDSVISGSHDRDLILIGYSIYRHFDS